MALPDFHDFHRGDTVPVFHFSVSAAEARAYLDATGDEHAALWTETVPPLAAGALMLAGLMDEVPLPPGAVHIGQDFEFVAPIAVDADIEARLTIAQQSLRGGSNVVVFGSEMTSGGRVVMRGRTMITAPARTDEVAK